MNNYVKIIISLTFISAICGAVLTFAYYKTKDKIAYADRLDFLSSLKIVLPNYDNEPDKDAIIIKDKVVYKATYNGVVTGYAIKYSSNKGYGGEVEIIVGVDNTGKILGVSVLKHKETPGLGDKITEDKFLNLFKSLSEVSKIAVKKDGGIIDQFSGATMSPRAVAEATSNALKFIQDNVIIGSNE